MGIFDWLFGAAKKDDKKKHPVVNSETINEDIIQGEEGVQQIEEIKDYWEVSEVPLSVYKGDQLIAELKCYEVFKMIWDAEIEDYDRDNASDICGAVFEGKIWEEDDFDKLGYKLSWESEEIIAEYDNFDEANNYCLELLDYPKNQPREVWKDNKK